MTSPQVAPPSSLRITIFPVRQGAPRPPLLLVAHCSQQPQPEYTSRTDEILSTQLPRVAGCLYEAQTQLSEERLEAACERLTKASTILDILILALVPAEGAKPPESASPVKAEDQPEKPPQVMAAVA